MSVGLMKCASRCWGSGFGMGWVCYIRMECSISESERRIYGWDVQCRALRGAVMSYDGSE